MELPYDPDEILKLAHRGAYLLAGYIKQTLTAEERKELDEWIDERPQNKRLFNELTNPKYIRKMMKKVRDEYKS